MDEITQKEEVTTVSSTPERVVKTTTVAPVVKTEHPQKVYEKKKVIFRAYQVIWYILAVIEVLLIFRVTLKALAANPNSGFASLVYAITDPLALPFQGILRTSVTSGSVFEWSTIIAAIVYALVAIGLVELFQFLRPVDPHEVSEVVDKA
jgi:uncharacterized protein YggT (Ycf19 family)